MAQDALCGKINTQLVSIIDQRHLLEQGVFLCDVNCGKVTSLFLHWITNYFKTKVKRSLIDIEVLWIIADVVFVSIILNVSVKLRSCNFDVFKSDNLAIMVHDRARNQ